MSTSTPTFYWYDFETFGLNAKVDRPAQFAGLRTTLDFQPIEHSERILYFKPSEDFLPNPQSALLTGITPQVCLEKGQPEATCAQTIFNELNTPQTISLGYNTLGFDDEVCRFLFWRNFLDPYSHSWANGCSRWDIFPLVCAVWSLRGQSIHWPQWEDIDPRIYPKAAGRSGPCFKLEFLTQANQLNHAHAHDALSDVHATMALARLIRDREPKLWQWALAHRSTEAVKKTLTTRAPLVWIAPHFRSANGFLGIVATLGFVGKDFYVWDLRADPSILTTLTAEQIHERFFMRKAERVAKQLDPLPLYRIKSNTSPFICPDVRVIPTSRLQAHHIDLAQIQAHFERLQTLLPHLAPVVVEAFQMRSETPSEPADIDRALYEEDFLNPHDRQLANELQTLTPEAIAQAVHQGHLHFDNTRLDTLLLRYRARNWPHTLSDPELQQWQMHCTKRLLEGSDPYVQSISSYFEAIDAVQESEPSLSETQLETLEALYAYGQMLGEKLSMNA